MVKIFESPDGGNTIYERDTETGERVLIQSPEVPEWYIDSHEFYEIVNLAEEGNKTLQNMLKEIKLVYEMSREHG